LGFNSKEECCFNGRGQVFCGPVDACRQPGYGMNYGNPSGTMFEEFGDFVGNTLDFTINQSVDRRPTTFRAGNYDIDDCSPKIITGATVNLTLTCSNTSNLTKALCGDVTENPPKVQTSCKSWCPKNGIICEFDVLGFPTPNVDADSVIIVDQDGVPLIKGEDYIVDCFCITFCRNMTFTKDQYLKITWTTKYAYTCIDALSKQSVNNRVTFKGKNLNDKNQMCKVTIFNVSFDPVSDYSFISENNQQIVLTGTLFPVNKYNLAYPEKNINNWYKITKVDKGGCHV